MTERQPTKTPEPYRRPRWRKLELFDFTGMSPMDIAWQRIIEPAESPEEARRASRRLLEAELTHLSRRYRTSSKRIVINV